VKQFPIFGKALSNCFIVSNLILKGGVVHFSNEVLNVWLMFLNHQLTTDIIKTVQKVHTTTTGHVQSTTQYKINLRLKSERAMTPSLEHEEVLSHSLLDVFFTSILVQKIATKGANFVSPSYMKKKTFCTDVY
jgi:hypothetical protein